MAISVEFTRKQLDKMREMMIPLNVGAAVWTDDQLSLCLLGFIKAGMDNGQTKDQAIRYLFEAAKQKEFLKKVGEAFRDTPLFRRVREGL